ncbi:G-protein coupled receptor [Metarhizium acridum CQMa 102]|uniref:G-protein coupled receptor n=1 Tax=Metarhizium acridum (strain CQMa 102) TaxID=655827 RepID=E9EGG8_METAQ|nr:G-protein coupled receptor [Metarhizium acridum CQMa 102]EFY84982.1 G-protein coupled receptor [Metarhizium acridum CQMa 102]
MSPLTESQLNAISIMERACSAISLLGCIFTITTFTCFSTFREKPVNRLVFYASFGNMASNVGTLMSRSFLGNLDSFGCQFQAMLVQWFMAADVGWILAMAVNVYLTVYRKFDIKRLHKMELIYLPACYGIPFIPAFTYLFVRHNGERIYGDAVLWCWVTSELEGLRIGTFYGPVWTMILITFSIYIAAAGTIFKIRRQVHDLSSDYDLSSCTSPEVTASNGTAATMSADGDAVFSGQTQGRDDKTTASRAKPRRHGPTQQSFARRRSFEHKNAAWSYTKCALLYFSAILITWIPASANRVYSMAHNGQPYAPVVFMSAFVLPLQGFWNWIIYVVMSWGACKSLPQDIKARFSDLHREPANRDELDRAADNC